MATEKTRVKEVLENIEPEKLNEYFKLKGIDIKLKKSNIIDVLEQIHDTEAFFELHKIYFFNQAPEEFEKILSFYEKATNSRYNNVVLALRNEENLTDFERALFLAIHNNNFFNHCFNAINIFATNTINYEIFTGVKEGVKIASENLLLLQNAIGEFSNKTFKSGADCVVEYFDLCDKDFFVVYANKGIKTYTEIEDKKVNRKKQKPVIEITFIYSQKEGKLEVGILNYKAKLLDFVALFGKHILKDNINTSNLKKVYDLGLIKQAVNKYGDFKFQNTKEMQLHISDLFYNTNDAFFGSIGGNKKNQANFLNKVQKDKLLINADLVKVRIIGKYKEEMENKTRTFIIQSNKCSLAYDKTDISIRDILNNSGLKAINNFEIIDAFKECLTMHKIVNLYNTSKMQENIKPFKWLINKNFLIQMNDISYNLYCEECVKVCNMEEKEDLLICGCGNVLYRNNLEDIEDYSLNDTEIKEMMISHFKLTKDDNIEDETYFAFHGYGKTGKINLHLVKEANIIEKLKQNTAKEKIIISVYGDKEVVEENCFIIPLHNLLTSNSHLGFGFCDVKFAEAVRVFAKNIDKSKTNQVNEALNEQIEYARKYNKPSLTMGQLLELVNKKYKMSESTFKNKIWKNVAFPSQRGGGRKKQIG